MNRSISSLTHTFRQGLSLSKLHRHLPILPSSSLFPPPAPFRSALGLLGIDLLHATTPFSFWPCRYFKRQRNLPRSVRMRDVPVNRSKLLERVRVLGELKQGEEAARLFYTVQDPEPELILAVMNACVRSERPRNAMQIFKEVRDRDRKLLNKDLYKTGMKLALSLKRSILVHILFQEMQAQNLQIDQEMCRWYMVNCTQDLRYWKQARELLARMKRDSIPVDLTTYHLCMSACLRGRSWSNVIQLFDKLISEQLPPSPPPSSAQRHHPHPPPPLTLAIYNTTLQALRHVGPWSRSLQLFQQLQQAGHTPNAITYSAVIQALEQAPSGPARQGFDLFRQMKQAGLKPNRLDVESLVTISFKMDNHREAKQLLKECEIYTEELGKMIDGDLARKQKDKERKANNMEPTLF